MQKLSITLLVTVILTACAASRKPSTSKAPRRLEHSLLWEISGNGLSQPSYLFGTMHLLCAEDAGMSDSLRYAVEQSSQVYFEIDLSNMMETMGALRFINMNGGRKLGDLLTAADYSKVKNYFEKNRSLLPLSMMERMKPYFITAMIAESKFPCAAKDGMEQVIMREAKRDRKPVHGLETVQFQASVFDSIPYERQAKDLVRLIDSMGRGDNGDEQLLEVYRSQDIDKMEEMTAGEEGMSDYLDLLLYNRNASWVKQMPAIMKARPVLFAVGAGHLGGQKGVIALLMQQGYRLRPMKHLPASATVLLTGNKKGAAVLLQHPVE